MGRFPPYFCFSFCRDSISITPRYIASARTAVRDAHNKSFVRYLHRILARHSFNHYSFYGFCYAPPFFPSGVEFDKVVRAMIGITLFQSAYTAEAVRGGLQAIDKGQGEASMALGMGYWRRNIFIILPQALKISIPSIVNTFIALFKDTSLVSIIGLLDLLNMSQTASRSLDWNGYDIEGYLFAGFIFWFFCYGMSSYSQSLEKKLDTDRRIE